MKKFSNKLNALRGRAAANATYFANKAKKALRNEDGDTNFLSIIIILAIVLIVAIVFITLKDRIIDIVNNAFEEFEKVFSSQKRK